MLAADDIRKPILLYTAGKQREPKWRILKRCNREIYSPLIKRARFDVPSRTPNFTRKDELLVHDITTELNTTHPLSEANFNRGIAMFGEQKMV